MKFRHLFCAAVLLIAPLSSLAFVPESGLYQMQTPDNTTGGGGGGLSIEIQNQYMFAAGYVYTPSGAPTFVTMQGPLTQLGDGTWVLGTSQSDPSNGLAGYTGGQCIGTQANCPYKKPVATKIGDFGIQFLGQGYAGLSWGAPGNIASATLRRLNFFTGSNEPSSLLGQWDVLISSASGANALDYSGDRIVFDADSSGNIIGCTANNNGAASCTAPRIAVTASSCGQPNCAINYLAVVYVGSTSHIVRVYSFSSNNLPGAFTQSFHGIVHFCNSGVASPLTCNDSSANFVAYKSASSQYAHTGAGMHQP